MWQARKRPVIKWMVIDNLDSWLAASPQLLAPGCGSNSSDSACLRLGEGSGDLLKVCAHHSFRNLTATYLRKLVDHLCIPHEMALRRMNVTQCLTCLLRHVWGDAFKDTMVEHAVAPAGARR